MIRIEPAAASDAEALTDLSRRAFDGDADYGAPGPGGPPGYDSAAWQLRMMKAARYFKVIEQDRTIGGLILFQRERGTVELGRVFIEPECQNRGLGREVLDYAESLFPTATRWICDTPSWNLRNHHFYEQAGYSKTGELDIGADFVLFQYEKRMT